MPKLLNKSTILMCPHGGQVTITTMNTRSKGGGDFLVCRSDMFTVTGCPLNVSGALHPCLTVEWSMEAQKSKSSGDAHLTESSVGLCKAGDGAVQGAVQVLMTQAKVQGI